MDERLGKLAVQRIRQWDPVDRQWWRDLLEQHPEEGALVAELVALLGARPLDE